MAITRKNRSLKKKPNGLKKKSNKSRKNSKKSQKVNKRKIRGGLFGEAREFWGQTISQDDFHNITERLKNSEKPLPDRIDDYIDETKHISQCKGKGGDEKSCEKDKYKYYNDRYELGKELDMKLINSTEKYNINVLTKAEDLRVKINHWDRSRQMRGKFAQIKGGAVTQDKFIDKTLDMQENEDKGVPLSKKIEDFIREEDHIERCGTFISKEQKILCKGNKFTSYGNRFMVGDNLINEYDKLKPDDITYESIKKLEELTNKWGEKSAEKGTDQKKLKKKEKERLEEASEMNDALKSIKN